MSLRFLPLTRTVSPRKSWSVSMVLFERAMIELSSLTASVTLGDCQWAAMPAVQSRRLT